MSLQQLLSIPNSKLNELNAFLMSPDNVAVQQILDVVDKYGTPTEINQRAAEAGQVENLVSRLKEQKPEYVADLEWLQEQRDSNAFISMDEFRRQVLGDRLDQTEFDESLAVTLEISAVQYFPWLIAEAKRAVGKGDLMPGRFIRVRKMKEQEADSDLLATSAALKIIGASSVETLDTKGTDGSNIHLNGPETLAGYFGGVGQPNDYPLKWLDEYLYYYTNYGVQQVLNVNAGTVLIAFLLHKLGVDIEFKISVLMGTDNAYSVCWLMMMAKLFSREDGSSPLIGLNFSNSVNNETIQLSGEVRGALNFEKVVRFEHHITETYKSFVRQPYLRRDELVELANRVANISAKHEGGEPGEEAQLNRPSDVLDYFRDKSEIIEAGEMDLHEQHYLMKHDSVMHTARLLTENGLAVQAAANLHHR